MGDEGSGFKAKERMREIISKIKAVSPVQVTAVRLLCLGLFLSALIIAGVQPGQGDAATRETLYILFQFCLVAMGVILLGRFIWQLLKELGATGREVLIISEVVLLCLLAGLLFLFFYYRAEQDVKVYDSTIYWIRTMGTRQIMAQSIPEYLKFLQATLSTEYNYLIAFPMALVSRVFGLSFTGYCQTIFVVYFIPTTILLSLLALRLVRLRQGDLSLLPSFSFVFILLTFSSVLLWPLVLGYADIAGVFVIALILNYAFDWDALSFSWRRNLILTALSLWLLLSRRWYAYYIVGFYGTVGVVSFIKMVLHREFSFKKFGILVANMAMIAVLAVAVIYALNPEIFVLFLGNDYSEAYNAFKANGPLLSFWYTLLHTGLLFCVVTILGLIQFIQHRKTRWAVLGIVLPSFVAVGLFLMVQDLGPHHEYLLTPTILTLCAATLVSWAGAAAKGDKPLVYGGLVVVLVCSFLFSYVPVFKTAGDFTAPLTSGVQNYPKQMKNYQAYHEIYDDLLAKTQDKPASVYIVGEGEDLNPEVFRRVKLPEVEDAAVFAMVNCTADLRDGFPSQVFAADYVMIVDPFSTDFVQIQQVGYQVYDMFLHDPAMAAYYTLDETYALEGHEALLYRKTKPLDKAGVDILKERLRAYYPDTPFVYEPAYFLALMEYDVQMTEYNFWDQALTFTKGADGPVAFRLNDTASFTALSFDVDTSVSGLTVVVENASGEIYRAPVETGRHNIWIDVAGSEALTVSFEDADTGNPVSGNFTVYFTPDSLT